MDSSKKTKNEKPLKFNSVPFEEFLESVINLKKNEILKLEETLEIIKSIKSSKNKITFYWNRFQTYDQKV